MDCLSPPGKYTVCISFGQSDRGLIYFPSHTVLLGISSVLVQFSQLNFRFEPRVYIIPRDILYVGPHSGPELFLEFQAVNSEIFELSLLYKV